MIRNCVSCDLKILWSRAFITKEYLIHKEVNHIPINIEVPKLKPIQLRMIKHHLCTLHSMGLIINNHKQLYKISKNDTFLNLLGSIISLDWQTRESRFQELVTYIRSSNVNYGNSDFNLIMHDAIRSQPGVKGPMTLTRFSDYMFPIINVRTKEIYSDIESFLIYYKDIYIKNNLLSITLASTPTSTLEFSSWNSIRSSDKVIRILSTDDVKPMKFKMLINCDASNSQYTADLTVNSHVSGKYETEMLIAPYSLLELVSIQKMFNLPYQYVIRYNLIRNLCKINGICDVCVKLDIDDQQIESVRSIKDIITSYMGIRDKLYSGDHCHGWNNHEDHLKMIDKYLL